MTDKTLGTLLLLLLLCAACGPGTTTTVISEGDGGTTTDKDPSKPGSTGSKSETASAREVCDTVIDWSHTNSTECKACTQLECSAERRSLADAYSTCERQFIAADNCSTCGCWDNAITNKTVCRPPWNDFVACAMNNCESPCK